MHNRILATGSLLSALGVIAGAFGAHGLQKLTSDEKILEGFRTAAQYQLVHAIALIIVGVLYAGAYSTRWLKWSAGFFIAGILLFSGSLYGLTFLKIQESRFSSVIGPVTPVGGLCFIIGWLLLAFAVLQKKKS